MVSIICSTDETIKLQELEQFQGNLKKRSKRDVSQLVSSIKEDGLIMPFAVWHSETGNKLLDGHGRLLALKAIGEEDVSVFEQDFPVIYIRVDTEEQARKALLQITSSYGKVTKDGAIEFCKTIPSYRAPAINRFVHRKPVERRLMTTSNERIIRIAVQEEKVQQLIDILKQVDFIRVL